MGTRRDGPWAMIPFLAPCAEKGDTMRHYSFLILFFMMICVGPPPIKGASTPLSSIDVECPDSGPHFVLWIEGSDGECKETSPGVYECWEVDGDYAIGNCQIACVETVAENIAGCRSNGSRSPGGPVPELSFTVECENGRRYELKGINGDTCTQNDEGTEGNHNVTGGQCQQTVNQELQVSTSVDCETGCGATQVPADCKRVDD
jgi:hypothetical protein